jgi:RecA-family ATPase
MSAPAPKPHQLAKFYDVPELLKIAEDGGKWLIKDVLRPGGQMILAGPPKSGKSLIAAEIALTLALPFKGKRKVLFGSEASKGKEPIAFEVEPPAGASGYKVVFFSFEMRPPEVAHRLRAQLGGLGLNPAKAKKDELSLPLVHVFGLNSQDGSERSDLCHRRG